MEPCSGMYAAWVRLTLCRVVPHFMTMFPLRGLLERFSLTFTVMVPLGVWLQEGSTELTQALQSSAA